MQKQKLDILEVTGIRVLTTKQIAEAYGVTKDKIIYNFNYNKDRYILGKHYIEVTGDELRRLKTTCENQMSLKYAKSLYLWTEKGALLHAKSLNTDKAWEVYDYLVDYYFRVKEKSENKEVVPITPSKKSDINSISSTKRVVVNIPENEEAQKLIKDMKKYLTGMEIVLEMYNTYQREENLERMKYMLFRMEGKIVDMVYSLYKLKPKLVEK
ncbi:ORF6N domain-containing protein [Enterocloster bolteae]|uniref:ORF6N domain-containing protein n=1 Tax=Enterocloster bolteae TaxID=208479 RepID=UPI00210CAE15|nr:ORF6N domain-containing protein [Enterocloster bolteae]MCQ4754733.1 ORF6N domain-containing protein [Enterocloster bolteae]